MRGEIRKFLNPTFPDGRSMERSTDLEYLDPWLSSRLHQTFLGDVARANAAAGVRFQIPSCRLSRFKPATPVCFRGHCRGGWRTPSKRPWFFLLLTQNLHGAYAKMYETDSIPPVTPPTEADPYFYTSTLNSVKIANGAHLEEIGLSWEIGLSGAGTTHAPQQRRKPEHSKRLSSRIDARTA